MAGKGTTSGYVPFGFAACSGALYDEIAPKGFVHGFTWSHNALGSAVALATLRRLRDDHLVDRAREVGGKLKAELAAALADDAAVGDVRGIGMMIGIELVADRETKEPFPRQRQVTEAVLAAARDLGLLLYSSTGHVDGADGDLVMLGPPFVLTDEDRATLVERTAAAIRTATA